VAALGDAATVTPGAWAPVRARGPVRAPAVAAVLLVIAINLLALPLRTGAAPLGLVSLQLAPDVGTAASILASWSAVPRVRLLTAHGLDLVLPVAYALAILRVAATAEVRVPRTSRLAAFGGVLAAAADQVENLAMAVTLLDAPSAATVAATRGAAMVKWPTLAVALVAASLAALAVRTRPLGGRRP
jgi:hypothetical protein